VLVQDGRFLVDKVEPGRWRAWLAFAGQVTAPRVVEVGPAERSDVALALSSGGGLRARIVGPDDRPADPASLVLRPVDGGPGGGELLGRAGDVVAQGILPGRYQATARGMGFREAATEPFDVPVGGTKDLGTIRLRKNGFLKIVSVTDESGRSPTGEVILTVKQGKEDFRTRIAVGSGLLPVEPGEVVLRATAGDRFFEQTFDVKDGETIDVRIVLQPKPR
jgi:hypothetical protein